MRKEQQNQRPQLDMSAILDFYVRMYCQKKQQLYLRKALHILVNDKRTNYVILYENTLAIQYDYWDNYSIVTQTDTSINLMATQQQHTYRTS